jgi:hypothetical protein
MRRIDERQRVHPYFGARRLTKYLRREGFEDGCAHATTLISSASW